jgi:ABC-type glycerol-3-phosphate transport system permease component
MDLEEAAMIDGCGKVYAMIRIVLPLAIPGIISISLFAFILSWNEYMFAMVMLNSGSKWTLPIGLAMYLHTDEVRWEQLLAATVLILVPVFLFFQMINRRLIAGLMAGSVKG